MTRGRPDQEYAWDQGVIREEGGKIYTTQAIGNCYAIALIRCGFSRFQFANYRNWKKSEENYQSR